MSVLKHGPFTYRHLFEIERRRLAKYGVSTTKYERVLLDSFDVHFEPKRLNPFAARRSYDFTVPAGMLVDSGGLIHYLHPNFYDFVAFDRYGANEWMIYEYMCGAPDANVRNMPSTDKARVFSRNVQRRRLLLATAPMRDAYAKVTGDVPMIRFAKEFGIDELNTLGAVMVDIDGTD